MKKHIINTRDKLGDLAGLADRTQRTEQRILEQAEKRLAEIQAKIDRSEKGVEGASEDGQSAYLELISERGQLQQVIARARTNLA